MLVESDNVAKTYSHARTAFPITKIYRHCGDQQQENIKQFFTINEILGDIETSTIEYVRIVVKNHHGVWEDIC